MASGIDATLATNILNWLLYQAGNRTTAPAGASSALTGAVQARITMSGNYGNGGTGNTATASADSTNGTIMYFGSSGGSGNLQSCTFANTATAGSISSTVPGGSTAVTWSSAYISGSGASGWTGIAAAVELTDSAGTPNRLFWGGLGTTKTVNFGDNVTIAATNPITVALT